MSKIEEAGYKLPEKLLETEAFNQIINAVLAAEESSSPLALITGAHGVGKTVALKVVSQRHGMNYLHVPPQWKNKHLAAHFGKAVQLHTGVGFDLQTSVLVDQLKRQPFTFILDEAQRLNYAAFDYMKFIADETGGNATFIFCASPSLERRIDKWADIATRVRLRVRVKPMAYAEFCKHFGHLEIPSAAMAEVHRMTDGVLRTSEEFLTRIPEALENHNMLTSANLTLETITPTMIRQIGGSLVNG